METKTKRTLLIVSIILLIVINISALSTIYFHNKIRSKKFIEIENMKQEAKLNGMHRYIKNELELSEEQFELFKETSRTNMITTHKITLKLNKKRYDMMEEIGKKSPNPENLEKIAKKIGSLHYELKKSTINHFMKLKEICNEDQQKDLQKLFMQMIHDQDKHDSNRNPREQRRNSRDHGRNKRQGR